MELEFFVKPGEDEEWHQKWVEDRLDWWVAQGVERNALQLYNVPAAARIKRELNIPVIVVGGNPLVGVILFLIFVTINFVVIAKGSGRIAEVADEAEEAEKDASAPIQEVQS